MILGVLLAAGTGSRFDEESDGEGNDGEENDSEENKLLTTLGRKPLAAHSARTLTESSLDAVVAVVGHDRGRVAAVLSPGIEIVPNPDYEQGQSTSVRRGVALARERGAEAVLFALGDMPCVAVETVEELLDAYRESASHTGSKYPGIVAPRYEDQRGNPVLFDSRYFDALADVEGDTGGRGLLESEPVKWVDVPDPGVHRDVDTVGDLRDLREADLRTLREADLRDFREADVGDQRDETK